MIDLTAADIVDALTAARLFAEPETRVTGPAITDSREVKPGALFVALRGENSDGHDFASQAVAAGAVLVIADHELPGLPVIVVPDTELALGELAREVLVRIRAQQDLTVIAVTGSAGKTTTKDLLLQVLSESGPTVAPVKSFNNEIGLPLTVLRADFHTRYLVLEMGANHLGELTYLTSIAPPDVSVVLMVGLAHVGEFGGIEAVAQAKRELITGLLPTGTAILNADDLRVVSMRDAAPGQVVTFGTVRGATVRADDIRISIDGKATFVLSDTRTGTSAPVELQITGEHHVTNALAVATVALQLGIDLESTATRLSKATALSPHRMSVTHRTDGVTIIDDSYNANPDSMRAALKSLAVMAGRKRRSIAVLGEMLEMGPDSRGLHDEIGRLAVRLNIRWVIVVGSGASGIFDGVTQEGSWGDEAVFVETLDGARNLLSQELCAGDVVLLKSSHGAGLWELGNELSSEQVAS